MFSINSNKYGECSLYAAENGARAYVPGQSPGTGEIDAVIPQIIRFFDTVIPGEVDGVVGDKRQVFSAHRYNLAGFRVCDGWELTLIMRDRNGLNLTFEKPRTRKTPRIDALIPSVGWILTIFTNAWLEAAEKQRQERRAQLDALVTARHNSLVKHGTNNAWNWILSEAEKDPRVMNAREALRLALKNAIHVQRVDLNAPVKGGDVKSLLALSAETLTPDLQTDDTDELRRYGATEEEIEALRNDAIKAVVTNLSGDVPEGILAGRKLGQLGFSG